jgi:hypothetical protein
MLVIVTYIVIDNPHDNIFSGEGQGVRTWSVVKVSHEPYR